MHLLNFSAWAIACCICARVGPPPLLGSKCLQGLLADRYCGEVWSTPWPIVMPLSFALSTSSGSGKLGSPWLRIQPVGEGALVYLLEVRQAA